MDGEAGHCPEASGSCCAARLPGCSAAGRGLLGSGEDASVRAHLPLSDHPECVADCGAGCLTSGYRCPL